MTVKDYYQVLNISPSASTEDIRKAFRKLALVYHPDKNSDPVFAAKRFSEIQEAYLVLKDTTKRAAYNYQRYSQHPQTMHKPLAANTGDILDAVTALRKKNAGRDPFRTNTDLLSFEIKDLLSVHNIGLLLNEADAVTNRRFLQQLLACTGPLPFGDIEDITARLHPLAAKDAILQKEITGFLRQLRWREKWGRYKVYLALAIAVIFCLALLLSV